MLGAGEQAQGVSQNGSNEERAVEGEWWNAWSRMLGAECFLEQNAFWSRTLFGAECLEQNAWSRMLVGAECLGADLYRIFIAFTTSDEQEAGAAKKCLISAIRRAPQRCSRCQVTPSDAK